MYSTHTSTPDSKDKASFTRMQHDYIVPSAHGRGMPYAPSTSLLYAVKDDYLRIRLREVHVRVIDHRNTLAC